MHHSCSRRGPAGHWLPRVRQPKAWSRERRAERSRAGLRAQEPPAARESQDLWASLAFQPCRRSAPSTHHGAARPPGFQQKAGAGSSDERIWSLGATEFSNTSLEARAASKRPSPTPGKTRARHFPGDTAGWGGSRGWWRGRPATRREDGHHGTSVTTSAAAGALLATFQDSSRLSGCPDSRQWVLPAFHVRGTVTVARGSRRRIRNFRRAQPLAGWCGHVTHGDA